jgi:hypothetical protein
MYIFGVRAFHKLSAKLLQAKMVLRPHYKDSYVYMPKACAQCVRLDDHSQTRDGQTTKHENRAKVCNTLKEEKTKIRHKEATRPGPTMKTPFKPCASTDPAFQKEDLPVGTALVLGRV